MVRNYLIIFFLLISSKIFAQSDTMRVGKQRCFKNPKFNGYLGTQVTNFSFNNPSFYGAGKAGLIQLTKYLACHLPDKGIRVNSVSPGPFPPQEIIKKHPDFYQKLINKVPLKRIGDPNELIGIVQFLLSDSSSYITGANIPVDGGWTAW